MQIDSKKLSGKAGVFESVIKDISPNDGMAKNTPEQYFTIGASAASVITRSLSAARKPVGSVRRVLDYACGYGRVLRWLKAEFPNAYLLGVDADGKAAASAQDVLGVETRKLDITLAQPIDDPFDLIWVGSLFTHLSERESKRVLQYLRRHLTDSGVLVFTTHGSYVAHRIETREKTYNLSEDAMTQLLSGYKSTDFGFAEYSNLKDYGISAATPSKVCKLAQTCDLDVKFFLSRGWAAHQDVFACTAVT
jgi:SAM-dependent methyltransferase